VNEAARGALLRQHPSSQAFERAADINGIHDFLRRERPYNETASVQLRQYALLRKHRQGLTNRGSRNAELSGKFNLPHALARGQLSMQDHLAYAYDYSGVFSHLYAKRTCSERRGENRYTFYANC